MNNPQITTIKKITVNKEEYVNYKELLSSIESLSDSLLLLGDKVGASYMYALSEQLKEKELYYTYPKKNKENNIVNLFGD